jgi:hypothetical protein
VQFNYDKSQYCLSRCQVKCQIETALFLPKNVTSRGNLMLTCNNYNFKKSFIFFFHQCYSYIVFFHQKKISFYQFTTFSANTSRTSAPKESTYTRLINADLLYILCNYNPFLMSRIRHVENFHWNPREPTYFIINWLV